VTIAYPYATATDAGRAMLATIAREACAQSTVRP
jgi:hypothetical protein